VGLHVHVLDQKEFLRPIDRQHLDFVDDRTPTVVSPTGIALCVLVGEDRTLRAQDLVRDDVFGGDQLDLKALTIEFPADR